MCYVYGYNKILCLVAVAYGIRILFSIFMFILMVFSLLYFFVGIIMCMYFGTSLCHKQVLIKYTCALQWSNLCLQFMFLYMLLMLLLFSVSNIYELF
jgi:hypothetical protein